MVALTWTDDRTDPQWEISNEALQILQRQTDARGRKLEVVKLHQPGPIYITAEEAAVPTTYPACSRGSGERLAGSYVNSFIGNGWSYCQCSTTRTTRTRS